MEGKKILKFRLSAFFFCWVLLSFYVFLLVWNFFDASTATWSFRGAFSPGHLVSHHLFKSALQRLWKTRKMSASITCLRFQKLALSFLICTKMSSSSSNTLDCKFKLSTFPPHWRNDAFPCCQSNNNANFDVPTT